jgi:hypothetical protein
VILKPQRDVVTPMGMHAAQRVGLIVTAVIGRSGALAFDRMDRPQDFAHSREQVRFLIEQRVTLHSN